MGAAVQPLPQGAAPVDEAFSLGGELLPLNASDSQDIDIAHDADADFFCTALTGIVGTTDLAFTGSPPLLVTIKSSSGDAWSNIALPWLSYFPRGDAREFFPFRFQPPRRMARNGTTKVTVTNLDAGNAYRIRVTFHGYRRYS